MGLKIKQRPTGGLRTWDPETAYLTRCDFNNNSRPFCDWTQPCNVNQGLWIRTKHDTPTDGTGPDADYPDGKGYFIYQEGSNLVPFDTNRLESPNIFVSEKICIDFWYYMFGSEEMNELRVLVQDSTGESVVWSRKGNQSSLWTYGAVTHTFPTQQTIKVIFEAVRGLTEYGDTALDNVRVRDGPCEAVPTPVPPTPTPTESTPRPVTEGICSIHGDPHYYTFDKQHHAGLSLGKGSLTNVMILLGVNAVSVLKKSWSGLICCTIVSSIGNVTTTPGTVTTTPSAPIPILGTCVVEGDPHYHTFDNQLHHFMGTCTYTLSKLCESNSSLPYFNVEAANEHRGGNTRVSYVQYVDIDVYGYRINLGQNRVVKVDGVNQVVPLTLAQGVSISLSGQYVVVTTDFGLKVKFDGNHRVEITLPGTYMSKVCGICGNYNGDKADDFLNPDGEMETNSANLGNSWQVYNDSRCLPDDGHTPNCTADEKDMIQSNEYCGLITDPSGPFQNCHSVIDPQSYFSSCQYDLCELHLNNEALCQNLQAYADVCQAAGVQLTPWRNATFCPLTCPANTHYEPCAAACPATCVDPLAPYNCSQPCVEGCVCDSGYLLYNDRCVPSQQCGCWHNGQHYPVGSEFWADNTCSLKCTCPARGSKVQCSSASCPAGQYCGVQNGKPECLEQSYGICHVHGDPHYYTFDKVTHNFMGTCTYTLAKVCSNTTSLPYFNVEAKNEHRGSTSVSYVREVVVEVYGERITMVKEETSQVLKGETFWQTNCVGYCVCTGNGNIVCNPDTCEVNGVKVDLPVDLNHQVRVAIKGHYVVIDTSIGIQVKFDGDQELFVLVDESLKGQLCGLCGTFNDNQLDDFLKPDQVLEQDANKFGDSWLVKDDNRTTGHFYTFHYNISKFFMNMGARDLEGHCTTCNMSCTFDVDFCGWEQATNDNFDWIRHKGPTPTPNTGPSHDHTTGEGYYIYLQGSEHEPSDVARLVSPECSSEGPHCFRFWYHMYGEAEAMALRVYVVHDETSTLEWKVAGNKGDTWNLAEITVFSEGNMRIVLEGMIGEDFRSDIALDDLSIKKGSCTADVTTTTPGTATTTPSAPIPILGTCVVEGDPHYHTFDNQLHHFMGTCTYTLSKLCESNSSLPYFNVEAANEHRGGNTRVSYVQYVDVDVYGQRIRLEKGGAVTVNGVAEILPCTPAVGVQVSSSGFYTVITTDFGLTVKFDGSHRVEVTLPSTFGQKVCGMCGNYNGMAADDFLNPEGVLEPDSTSLGNSWQVSNDSSCSAGPPPTPACTETDKEVIASSSFCGLLSDTSGPFQMCHAVLSPSAYFDTCLYDLCELGLDHETLCKSLQSYADACQSLGVKIPAWRNATFCPLSCPANSYYDPCMTGCPATCVDRQAPQNCSKPCMEGCACTSGFLLSGDTCVPEANCGCLFEGNYYSEGEYSVSENCTRQCRCEANGQMNCSALSCAEDEVCKIQNGQRGCYPASTALCHIYGDPHYSTFDGKLHHFQGACNYTVVTGCDNSSVGFSITTRNEHRGSQSWTALNSVALSMEGLHIELRKNKAVYINGALASLPASPAPGVTISLSGSYVRVSTSLGLQLQFNGDNELLVTVSEKYKGKLCGLCGTYTGSPEDDFTRPDGVVVPNFNDFGNSWMVPDDEWPSTFFYTLDPIAGYHNTATPHTTANVSWAEFRSPLTQSLGTCVVEGDPHYHTFDNQLHHFMGTCTYTLSKLCESNSSLPYFNVEAANEHRGGNTRVSYVQYVDVDVYGQRIRLEKGGAVTVNGVAEILPCTPAVGVQVSSSGFYTVITTDFGLTVKFDGSHRVEVTLPSTFGQKVCGMCGNYNGMAADDFLNPEGVLEPDSTSLGNSWQVSNDSSCSAGPPPTPACTEADKEVIASSSFCGLLSDTSGPFQMCHAVLSPSAYFDTCLYDLCELGLDHETLCKSLQSYADACQSLGVKIPAWRNATFCPLSCPANSYYDPCMTGCPATCVDRQAPQNCSKPCMEGCACTSGFLLSGDTCVPEANCGCLFEGNYYSEGEYSVSENCTRQCRCEANGQMNCSALSCAEDEVCKIQNGQRGCYPASTALCHIYGDPHYSTFDGKLHHFQGACNYTVVTGCDNSSVGFSITTRNEHRGSQSWTALNSVALSMEGLHIELRKNKAVYINGALASLPASPAPGVTISLSGSYVRVSTSLGLQLQFNGDNELLVTVSEKYKGKLCGLCGTYTGSPEDDFTRPDGVVVPNFNDFGNSWMVPDDEWPSTFFYTLDPIAGYHNTATPHTTANVSWAEFRSPLTQSLGTCVVEGDPHYHTFDNQLHHFMGTCTYTLSKLCESNSSLPYFNVEAANEHRGGNTRVSYVQYVDVDVYGQRIRLEKGGAVTVNGVAEILPCTPAVGVQVSSSGFYTVITTDFGLTVKFDGSHRVEVTLPSTFGQKVCGMCGNYNGMAADDFLNPEGVLEPDSTSLGNSWQVSNDSSCSAGPPPTPACTEADKEVIASSSFCGLLSDTSGPFQMCHAVLSPSAYFDTCLYDLCELGLDHETLCKSLQSYADACQSLGVKIPAWRNATFCPLSCPANSYYDPCMTGCPATCVDRQAPQNCSKPCMEGCACTSGFLLSGDTCVPEANCGCLFEGNYYSEGEYSVSENCTRQCRCEANGQMNCSALSCAEDEVCKIQNGQRGCYPASTALCHIYGDPHYSTFDGKLHHFQGACNYTVVTGCDNSSVGFSITTRNEHRGSQSWTALNSVALSMEGLHIELRKNKAVYINGALASLPASPAPGVTISLSGSYVRVSTSLGLQLQFNGDNELLVTVSEKYKGKLCGLCGTYTGSPEDDFTRPDGVVVPNFNDFGNSWMVPDDEWPSTFFYTLDPIAGYHNTATPHTTANVSWAEFRSPLTQSLGTCVVEGDPHYHTFDNQLHHFMGTCTYTLSKLCESNSSLPYFNVEAANEHRGGNTRVSYVQYVDVDVYGQRIRLEKGGAVTVNGVAEILPCTPAVGVQVSSSGFYTVITTDFGLTVKFDGSHRVEVTLPSTFGQKVCGMCGNYNGMAADDFLNPEGVLEPDSTSLGNSWQVSNDSSCSAGPPPTPACTEADKEVIASSSFCGLLSDTSGPFQMCHAVLSPSAYFDTCFYDLCELGLDHETLCKSLQSYADACQSLGVKIPAWRNATFCPLSCPANSYYDPCMTGCPATCVDRQAPQNCSKPCMEGCACTSGFLLSGDTCVPEANCGCLFEGNYYSEGEYSVSENCTRQCRCEANGQMNCSALSCAEDEVCKIQNGQRGCYPASTALCHIYGDPHYSTFDGKLHHFQGACNYTVVTGCDNSSVGFSITTRNEHRGSQSWTALNSVALSMEGLHIELRKNKAVYINGALASLPASPAPGVTISLSGSYVRVSTSLGLQLQFNGDNELLVTVSEKYKGKLCGLCGTYTGSPEDDFTRPDGVVVPNFNDFGNSWMVPDDEWPSINHGTRDLLARHHNTTSAYTKTHTKFRSIDIKTHSPLARHYNTASTYNTTTSTWDKHSDFCDWVLADYSSIEWIRHKGPTPTQNTGPSSDHTTGDGYYIYLQGRDALPGFVAELVSPVCSSEGPHCFRFWYHMYGEATTMALRVYVVTGKDRVLVWSSVGNHGDTWNLGEVTLQSTGDFQPAMLVAEPVTSRAHSEIRHSGIPDMGQPGPAVGVFEMNGQAVQNKLRCWCRSPLTISCARSINHGTWDLLARHHNTTSAYTKTHTRFRSIDIKTHSPLARHYNTASTYNNTTSTWDKHRSTSPNTLDPTAGHHNATTPHTRNIISWDNLRSINHGTWNLLARHHNTTSDYTKTHTKFRSIDIKTHSPLARHYNTASTYNTTTSTWDKHSDFCDWVLADYSSIEWIRHKGPTPTQNTGPSSDHTTGDGYYIYLQGRDALPGFVAELVSPVCSSEGPHCFRFWYHMYGEATTMALRVYVVTGKDRVLVWSSVGNHGDTWNLGEVTLQSTGDFQPAMLVAEPVTSRAHSEIRHSGIPDMGQPGPAVGVFEMNGQAVQNKLRCWCRSPLTISCARSINHGTWDLLARHHNTTSAYTKTHTRFRSIDIKTHSPLARHYNTASTYNNTTSTWDKHRSTSPNTLDPTAGHHNATAPHTRNIISWDNLRSINHGTWNLLARHHNTTSDYTKTHTKFRSIDIKTHSPLARHYNTASTHTITTKTHTELSVQYEFHNQYRASCSAFGDPHYDTFDHRVHNFMGNCTYTLSKVCNISETLPYFDVSTSNEHRGVNTKVSYVKSVQVEVYGNQISLLKNKKVNVNGTRMNLPILIEKKISIQSSGGYILLETDFGLWVRYDGNHYAEVSVPSSYSGLLCGLCGNYNGDPNDDNIKPNGDIASTSTDLGESWLVPENNTICSSETEEQCDPVLESEAKKNTACGMITDPTGIFKDCHTKVSPENFFDNCVYDMCFTDGLATSLCYALQAYAESCINAGICIEWRNATLCRQATCQVAGDPHYFTFDGKMYTFMGTCTYTLVEVVNNNSVIPITILGKNEDRGLRGATYLKEVYIDVYGVRITLQKSQGILLNNERVYTPLENRVRGLSIESVGRFIVVETDFGVIVKYDGNHHLEITLPHSYFSKVHGMCGNFNDNGEDDLSLPNGTLVSATEFGNSWKVEEDSDAGCLPDLREDDSPPCTAENRPAIESQCNVLKSDKFEVCHNLVKPEDFIESCIYDMCQYDGMKSTLCDIVQVYVDTCRSYGITIKWRNSTFCPLACPPNSHYTDCVSTCPSTCNDIFASSLCEKTEECTEGCECDDNHVLSNGNCVPLSNCGCRDDDNNYYSAGETWVTPHCTSRCECQQNGVIQCKSYSCDSNEVCGIKNGKHKCNPTGFGKCQIMGDPHYITFDHLVHHFQGRFTYILVQTIPDLPDTLTQFSVEGVNYPLPRNKRITYLKEVLINVYGHTVRFRQNKEVLLDGVRVRTPAYPHEGIHIYQRTTRIYLQTDFGLYLSFDGNQNADIKLATTYRNRVEGLCGNFDGISRNDFTKPDGVQVKNVNAFGNSWKVPVERTTSRFRRDVSLDEESEEELDTGLFQGCNEDQLKQESRISRCQILMDSDGPFANCHSTVSPDFYYTSCLFDMCEEGDEDAVLCRSLEAYVLDCQQQEVRMDGWRQQTVCALSCPANSNYSSCMSACPASCMDFTSPSECESPCVEGCECLPGYILSGSDCVPYKQCGCTYLDKYYEIGEIFTIDDCSQECRCTESSTVSCTINSCGSDKICGISNYTRGCYRSGPCMPNPCKNDGVCSETNSTSVPFYCECSELYTGQSCDIERTVDTPTKDSDSHITAIIIGVVAGVVVIVILVSSAVYLYRKRKTATATISRDSSLAWSRDALNDRVHTQDYGYVVNTAFDQN
ncbi:IgGFc-binding protein-like [Columba livia]|nr:IgGFc-binding protein-like [Columba livia]